MPQNKAKKARKQSIEESAKAIFDKAEAREKAGRDSFEAGWQATLEIMLLMMEKHLAKHPGQLLPMQISGQKEWEFYQDIQAKLDLPPNVCAVLMTPSAFKDMPGPKDAKFQMIGAAPWKRNAYSIIISHSDNHRIIMQVSLPGLESVGIDVFEDGNHLADYTYNTIEECLNDVTKVTWIHFRPKGEWTEEQIIRYTENWFAKGIDIDLEDAILHEEYSYIHHPELLDLTPLEAVLRLIGAAIPKEYDSLEKAIKTTNELNEDFDLGDPVITKEGILKDNLPECKALLGRIEAEIDQHLDTLEYLKGVKFPHRSIEDKDYNSVFDETSRKVYEVITGRPCPESVNIN